MDYLYAPKEDFSFLASGNVIKHFSGMPCFPVRLTLELFERAYRLIGKDRISLYDPCCGNGFSITVLGLMCSDKLAALSGSDISPACVNAARCNASLLIPRNLLSARDALFSKETTGQERRDQLQESIDQLLRRAGTAELPTDIFQHDILSAPPKQLRGKADLIFADIPYGSMTAWQTETKLTESPVDAFLNNLLPIMHHNSVLIVCGSKSLKIQNERFTRLDKLRAGKRLIYLLKSSDALAQ